MRELKSVNCYTVKKRSGPADISAEWNSPDWQSVQPVRIDRFRPESSAHQPVAECRLQHGGQGFYGLFLVRDNYVRCVTTEHNGNVCQDSCVEFFVEPPGRHTVNLYAPAQATIDSATFRQETDYPNSGRVRLAVSPEKPAVFTLRLRIPSWATQASVTVNGQPAEGAVKPGAFFAVRRELRSGDEVRLEMPMGWRLVKGRQRQAGRVAVMRGPQVFCLDPAQHPALAKLDGTELGYLALNPDSLGEPVGNTAVRPDGLGCGVQMWKPGFGLGKKADYELTLTEFPNAEGKATYFRLRDYSLAVDDELFSDR